MPKTKELVWMFVLSVSLFSCGTDDLLRPDPNDKQEQSESSGDNQEAEKPDDAPGEEGNADHQQVPGEQPEGDGSQPEGEDNGSVPGENPLPEEGQGQEEQRPDDTLLARRATLRLRQGMQPETCFDLDRLWLNQDLSIFTPPYMNRFLEFYSTTHDGKPYVFTSEDLAQCEVRDLAFSPEREEVSFRFVFKGVSSQDRLTFSIRKNLYYANQVRIRPGIASTWYVQGIKQHPELFGNRFVEYDDRRFVVQCKSIVLHSGSDTKVSAEYELCRTGSEVPLARFFKEVNGFKPLERLASELLPMVTTDLRNYMKKHFKTSDPEGDVTDRWFLKNTRVWIPKVEFHLAKGAQTSVSLVWHGGRVLSGAEEGHADVYLEDPRFDLVKAEIVGDNGRKFMRITLRLVSVNESYPGDHCVLPVLNIHL